MKNNKTITKEEAIKLFGSKNLLPEIENKNKRSQLSIVWPSNNEHTDVCLLDQKDCNYLSAPIIEVNNEFVNGNRDIYETDFTVWKNLEEKWQLTNYIDHLADKILSKLIWDEKFSKNDPKYKNYCCKMTLACCRVGIEELYNFLNEYVFDRVIELYKERCVDDKYRSKELIYPVLETQIPEDGEFFVTKEFDNTEYYAKEDANINSWLAEMEEKHEKKVKEYHKFYDSLDKEAEYRGFSLKIKRTDVCRVTTSEDLYELAFTCLNPSDEKIDEMITERDALYILGGASDAMKVDIELIFKEIAKRLNEGETEFTIDYVSPLYSLDKCSGNRFRDMIVKGMYIPVIRRRHDNFKWYNGIKYNLEVEFVKTFKGKIPKETSYK